MKLLFGTCLIILFSSQLAHAGGFFDQLTPRARSMVQAGVGLAGALGHSGHASGEVMATGSEELCQQKFEQAQKLWDQKARDQRLLSVIFLQYPLYDRMVRELSLDINDLPANSWSPRVAPHIDSQCKKFWKEVGFGEFSKNDKGALCRTSSVAFAHHEYNVIACSGEMEIKIDLDSVR